MTDPLVGIIMGSRSDWETMRHAADALAALEVPFETKIVSAHRTPERLYDYARGAAARGLRVLVAGAGGAAHLPGMAAAMTRLPVLGVPVQSKTLSGLDSLLSIVQMPGGVPVGTLAIGAAGATNAGLLAAQILALADPALAARIEAWRAAQTAGVDEAPNETDPPGATIGILGGGQLGRMLAMAAAQLGYRVHVYAPEASGPASEVAWAWTRGAYDDAAAVARFAAGVDIVTYEFENVLPGPLRTLANVAPPVAALDVAQDRDREKAFVAGLGGRPAPWRPVASLAELEAAAAALGTPAVLKTRRFGYDGKGQARLMSAADAPAAWAAIGEQPAVLEAFIPFTAEFSVLLARGADGASVRWAAVENRHEAGILRRSAVPIAPALRAQAEEAAALAGRIADALDYVGVLACEFFATAAGPVFNEMAPRVHNSGHWTIEGAITSQFENHIRAICGLPLGVTELAGGGAAMENLIGDEAERWPALLAEPGARLHLYGKKDPRPGRKMGHVTRVRR